MQSVPTPNASARSYKRRSARVPLKIQLVIEVGDDSVLDAETITVSKHGARIKITSSRGRLAHGERVRVSKRRGAQERQYARVVWLDKRSEPHYGIELDEPCNIWGVHFPAKDGTWHLQRKEVRRAQPAAHPAAQPAAQPAVAPSLEKAVPAIADVSVPKVISDQPASPKLNRTSALVAGISAVRLPFAERVDVIFTHPQEGTALLQTVVEPGAELRLTFPGNRVTRGCVTAVGGEREEGKWRVRIKCDGASA